MLRKKIAVAPVTTGRELKQFIDFPYLFHARTPHWIPPLKIEQKAIFNPKKNSGLRHCRYRLFLLYEGDRVSGRIAAYINHAANNYWNSKIGFFGYYECIDDPGAAVMLLETAEKWLKEQGMESMRGQWNLTSQDIGFVYEGFELPPTILSSYNPPYYNDHMKEFGMEKAKDLVVYNCDLSTDYKIPPRFLALTGQIARRYGVKVRPINMKKIKEETLTIVRLTNDSLKDNWGYYPVDETEAEQIAADLKMIIHPEVILIAEVEGKPIGYLLAVPDVNDILKDMNGRLFPLGIFRLLRGIKKLNRYRIWAMALLPPYQKRGISVLLFRRLNEILAPRGSYIEVNWVLEDNDLMNNALLKLELGIVKRYRIYSKEIS
ncbi:MAG: GNAT family N-acetyltransferase [bacterium]|nr:GNAT family N-acetyltransferase [bacterium]